MIAYLLVNILVRLGLLKKDLDYHLFVHRWSSSTSFFGYQKWFPYEAQTLVPFGLRAAREPAPTRVNGQLWG